MQKRNFFLVAILIFLASFFCFQIKSNRVFAASKGSWVYVDKKLVEIPQTRAPFSTEISGEEGNKTMTAKFENQGIKEIAVIQWGWTVPPKKLNPGDNFEMVMTGNIKEWKTTHFFSGSMYSRIQRFGATCCDVGGPDLGFIRMDHESGDPIGVVKTVKKSGMVPAYGDLGSNSSNRIQILVKLMQNSADYQWIYIYEWKEVVETKKTEIQLKIGSKNALVNDSYKVLDSPPFIENGRTYIPFRFLGESFGATIDFTVNPTTKLVDSVHYKLELITITLFLGKNEAFVNQKRVLLEAPPLLKNNRIMAPLRFVSENLSAKVDWNPLSQTIIIRKE